MFLLSLFGKTKPYSNQGAAERAATLWLNKHTITNYWLGLGGPGATPNFRKEFEDAMRKEDYHACIEVWNKYIIEHCLDDSARKVIIEEVKLDDNF